MANLIVAVGQFFSNLIGLAIAIPLWFIFAFILWFITTALFGPVLGTLVAIIVYVHFSRRG